MADEKRFVVIYKQGGFANPGVKILVDKVTGVNYVWTESGYAGGLTPLLDRDGKPVISTLPLEEE
jgi:hypothetical protein